MLSVLNWWTKFISVFNVEDSFNASDGWMPSAQCSLPPDLDFSPRGKVGHISGDALLGEKICSPIHSITLYQLELLELSLIEPLYDS